MRLADWVVIDHEPLQPRLQALVMAHEEDLAKAASLEKRIGALLEQHATKVCMHVSMLPLNISLTNIGRCIVGTVRGLERCYH